MTDEKYTIRKMQNLEFDLTSTVICDLDNLVRSQPMFVINGETINGLSVGEYRFLSVGNTTIERLQNIDIQNGIRVRYKITSDA